MLLRAHYLRIRPNRNKGVPCSALAKLIFFKSEKTSLALQAADHGCRECHLSLLCTSKHRSSADAPDRWGFKFGRLAGKIE